MGVRPEAVLVAREAAPGSRPLEAHIIEPLGAYDIVDLKLGEQLPAGAHASGFVRSRGDRCGRGSTRAQVHFFDATQRRRRCRQPAGPWPEISARTAQQALRRRDRARRPDAGTRGRRVLRAARADRRRQDHDAAADRRARAARRRADQHRRRGRDGWSAAQRDVALVFQHYSLYPRYTVRENLAFPLKSKVRDFAPTRSSGGWRGRRRSSASSTCSSARPTGSPAARCSASRSAAPSCATRRVFLMDEPLSNLDAKLREVLRAELKDLQARSGRPSCS